MEKSLELTPEFVQECNLDLQMELFALPIAPTKIASIYGMDLYSSDNLRDKYTNAMYKISKVKPVAADIERLIKSGKIIPCWINKGIFRLGIFKKLAARSEQGIAAFFSMDTKQIFILMDNNIDWGFAKDKVLADLMLHELMHMASDRFKGKFIGTFWNEFVLYYSALFQEIFKTQDNNISEEVKLIIRFLFKNFEYGRHNSGTLTKYLNLVNQCFRKKSILNENEFNSVLTDFYHYIALYFKDINSLYKQLRKFSHIYRGLTEGYLRGLQMKNDQSFCGQEFFYPSEVIAMYIEFYKGSLNKPFKVIKQL